MRVRLGDEVEEGQPLLDLLSTGRGHEEALSLAERAVSITGEPPLELPTIISEGVQGELRSNR
jgi:multidrug efflux pump subunit AcrA (membrane-fusion protein)